MESTKPQSTLLNIIEIDHLHKSFGEVKAVQDLSFCVKEGELFAFLGVNGAGKSTTINIMCGKLAKDSGSVTICGTNLDSDPEKIKRSLGVVFQSSVLDRNCRSGTTWKAGRHCMVFMVQPLKRAYPSWRSCWNLRICSAALWGSSRAGSGGVLILPGRCCTILEC